jgi:fluoride exporter
VKLDRSELAVIFLGGAGGALARVGLTQLFPATAGHWPWAVFAINIAGAFLLGYLVRHVQWRGSHRLLRPLLGPGFCGAFTTFSTMQLELLDMVRGGHGWLALLYVLASVILGLAAVEAGTLTAHGLSLRFGVPADLDVPGAGGAGPAPGQPGATEAER